jgi:6-phosphogluconolactonase
MRQTSSSAIARAAGPVAELEVGESIASERAWCPEVIVAEDPVAAAAVELARGIDEVLEERANARLAIAGGSSLAALAQAREKLAEAWSRVQLTWVDERCVPVSHVESNRGAVARMGLLDTLYTLDTEGTSRDRPERGPGVVLPLFEDDEAPSEAVERVGTALEVSFHAALDVLLLGMGEDGHIASLFPSRNLPARGLVAHISDSPKPPPDRITLTRPLLATARRSVLLAMGEGKRNALERLLTGDSRLPACGLPGLFIVTDLELGAS